MGGEKGRDKKEWDGGEKEGWRIHREREGGVTSYDQMRAQRATGGRAPLSSCLTCP